jgi:hypothetical protein
MSLQLEFIPIHNAQAADVVLCAECGLIDSRWYPGFQPGMSKATHERRTGHQVLFTTLQLTRDETGGDTYGHSAVASGHGNEVPSLSTAATTAATNLTKVNRVSPSFSRQRTQPLPATFCIPWPARCPDQERSSCCRRKLSLILLTSLFAWTRTSTGVSSRSIALRRLQQVLMPGCTEDPHFAHSGNNFPWPCLRCCRCTPGAPRKFPCPKACPEQSRTVAVLVGKNAPDVISENPIGMRRIGRRRAFKKKRVPHAC